MPILRFLEGVNFNSLHLQVLLETPSSKEIRICMPEGQEMREHQAPGQIVVRVLKGRIWFEVGGTRHTLEMGDCIALDANTPHSLGGLEDSVLNLSLHKTSAH
ncbi:cupin domain-containing protein [Helicobacter labacensis]|uniref:cupin domain-containing protein n=1 Tax=Helicobacter labacensis TaxID=2316079 RepID=UPI000EB42528|nr:cupin domain-containing protein [Helicobacter labacensis]